VACVRNWRIRGVLVVRNLAALGLVAGLVLGGCSARRGDEPIVSRLYFGLSTPTDTISVGAFDAFVDSVITPRFPDGLTRYQAQGQWRDDRGVVRKEGCVVVEIVHACSPADSTGIADIVERYKAAFRQQSVLLVELRPQAVRF
jgi:hypothetical protein